MKQSINDKSHIKEAEEGNDLFMEDLRTRFSSLSMERIYFVDVSLPEYERNARIEQSWSREVKRARDWSVLLKLLRGKSLWTEEILLYPCCSPTSSLVAARKSIDLLFPSRM